MLFRKVQQARSEIKRLVMRLKGFKMFLRLFWKKLLDSDCTTMKAGLDLARDFVENYVVIIEGDSIYIYNCKEGTVA